jgi:hypothetical protein
MEEWMYRSTFLDLGPRYPFSMRLGGPQSRSGRYGEVKIFDPTGTRTPTPLVVQPVALSTELSRLQYKMYEYTGPLSVQAQYSRSCSIISSPWYNSSLVTWTVVCLTAAKFKPLIFPEPLFASSNVANMCIFMILNDFCLMHWTLVAIVFKITLRHGPRRTHNTSIVVEACLPHRCIETGVLLLSMGVQFLRKLFTKSLPSNERSLWLCYSGFQAWCHNIKKNLNEIGWERVDYISHAFGLGPTASCCERGNETSNLIKW